MATNNLKKYNQNRSKFKGLLFELVLKELLLKAGFTENFQTDQLTRNRKRLHGRGATYDPDFLGVFRIGIPFVNPLLLLVEAKNFNKKVSIKTVREFLGAYIDVIQYERINTKASGKTRYERLHSMRYTYCPVFFSMKGFDKPAQGLMFAHGINFISYENSEIIQKIENYTKDILKELRFASFSKGDFTFTNIHEISNKLNDNLKKENFNKQYSKLIKFLGRVQSYIGVLDMKYPIHILKKNKGQIKPKWIKEAKLSYENDKIILLNGLNRPFGEFSFPKTMIEEYLKYAEKKDLINNIFKQIDIIIPTGNYIELRQILITDDDQQNFIHLLKQI